VIVLILQVSKSDVTLCFAVSKAWRQLLRSQKGRKISYYGPVYQLAVAM